MRLIIILSVETIIVLGCGFFIASPVPRTFVQFLLCASGLLFLRTEWNRTFRTAARSEDGTPDGPVPEPATLTGIESPGVSGDAAAVAHPASPGAFIPAGVAGELREAMDRCSAEAGKIRPPEVRVERDTWNGEIDRLEADSKFISENVRKAFDISDNLSKTAQEAFTLSESAQKGIKSVTDTLGESIRQADRLYEQSAQISRILDLMSDLAAKTHVLSINASIVSARAGTQGKAFDVVAREIRGLAHETDRSLREIETHIGEIRQSIVAVVENTRSANDEITREKSSLMSVAGALQGAILAVEVIRTVSGVAREKSEAQLSSYAEVREFFSKFQTALTEAGSSVSVAVELTRSFEAVFDTLRGHVPDFTTAD